MEWDDERTDLVANMPMLTREELLKIVMIAHAKPIGISVPPESEVKKASAKLDAILYRVNQYPAAIGRYTRLLKQYNKESVEANKGNV